MADRVQLPKGPAAQDWIRVGRRLPPLHQQVLVLLKHGVGFVCDVACYVGLDTDGLHRWILADVFLESKQIEAWSTITLPGDVVWPWANGEPA